MPRIPTFLLQLIAFYKTLMGQSNGLIVGPEFSRMIAEVLLQQIDTEAKLLLLDEGVEQGQNYKVFRYVDDIFVFADSQENINRIIRVFEIIGNRYLLHLNELKLTKGLTPPLPKRWLERTRILADKIDGFFIKINKHEYDMLPDKEKHLIKSDYFPVDRIKDEFITLMNDFQDNRRTIVSFLLSALLNNISKVKDGFRLFANEKANKALLLIDLAFFMYAFSPIFDSTRKLISMISYMNNEINFMQKDSKENEKLKNVIQRYSFIFQRGNLPDITDWFPFFAEYHISLDATTETEIIKKADANNNPITWANILLYSKYYQPFYDEIKTKVDMTVDREVSKLSPGEYMMQAEFWYILIYHNCPHISIKTRSKIDDVISSIRSQACKQMNNGNTIYTGMATDLICDFLCQQSSEGNKPLESFYDWNENRSISQQITYRTFQRTIFKKYRKNRNNLFASID